MTNQRINKLRGILLQKNLDAFFVSDFYNIFYLTGFKTLTADERAAFCLVTQKNIYLFTDGRYYNKFKNQKSKIKIEYKIIEQGKNLIYLIQEIIGGENLHLIGFEADDIRFIEYQGISKNLKVSLVPTEKIIIKIREIKDAFEVEKIKKACAISDLCLKEIIPIIKLNTTEKEIAFRLEHWLKEKYYDTAFTPIVAIDEAAAIPHYNTQEGNGKVDNGSIILIDFGAKYQNYLSDITRTIFFGKPDNEVINIYNKLLKAQEKTIEEIKKTKDPKTVDRFCRAEMIKDGLPNYPHSTGHGVGLEIHEYPKISQNSLDMIMENQIFTVEPGVYFEGKFGIRIEDTVWVKTEGEVEILTKFEKTPYFI